ncbi:MAG: Uncharacterized protein AUREO_060750 [Aureobasidium pullulans]|nr:MAG: Uncharacterized protein AUREO_060750 [Aureobasidium pullulans]
MSLTPAHGSEKPAADGNGDASTRQRVGSLAAVNADSLSQHSLTAPTVKSGSTPSKELPIHPPRKSSGAAADLDPYSASHIYYGASHNKRNVAKARTYSAVDPGARANIAQQMSNVAPRRLSHDEQGDQPRRYLINVADTLEALLHREDSDNNQQITVEDVGPKTIQLGTAGSGGYKSFDIRGTYMLSNLLQELTLAKEHGRKQIVLDEARLSENPVSRLSRLIKDFFWPNLTRRIDGSNIAQVGKDAKDWTDNPRPRIYVPLGAPEQHQYYSRIAREHPDMNLDVVWLPQHPDNEEYVRDLNEAPGLLALEMERVADTPSGEPDFKGLPFIVPGGRFNELYGWDSYMTALGLLIHDREDLAKNMVKHFCFEIKHYGKILNANRSYYLCRTQPPFLTDMALRVHDRIKDQPDAREFLRIAILAAIKEYHSVWTAAPRFDQKTGLSCYRPGGLGVPPETEATHFVHVLEPYCKKHNMEFKEFVHAYNYGHIYEPELDQYFLHDRAVRESGHDTSYRLEGNAAHLATVDLNSLLYKYETDIARTIRNYFGDSLAVPAEFCIGDQKPGHVETSATWDRRAKRRKQTMDKLMWDEEKGMFFDYDIVKNQHTGYESATTFWAMWAGACTPRQAAMLVEKALPLFEELGGLAAGTERSRGKVGLSRPNRQWDYPFGWAPQQILAWTGLVRFGYEDEAKRLAYRWVYMVTKAFVDFNGVVVEKYDVCHPQHPHKVAAEYGNQGSDFKGVAKEGFGWVNASYVYGVALLDAHQRRAVGALTPWETYQKATALH